MKPVHDKHYACLFTQHQALMAMVLKKLPIRDQYTASRCNKRNYQQVFPMLWHECRWAQPVVVRREVLTRCAFLKVQI